jgi:DNA-binding transcriptional ArsR family regulator
MPTETTNANEAARATLLTLADPLKTHLAALTALIEEREEELKEIRVTRAEVRRALAMIDPSTVVARGGTKKGKAVTRSATHGVAADTLDAIRVWLREHVEEVNGNGGFMARALIAKYGYTLTSRATLDNALRALREEGFVRLDHGGTGGAKFYKVVA